MIAVIAGNHRQYDDFIRRNRRNPKEYVFVHDIRSAAGLKFSQIVKVGDWYNLPDTAQLLDYVSAHMETKP